MTSAELPPFARLVAGAVLLERGLRSSGQALYVTDIGLAVEPGPWSQGVYISRHAGSPALYTVVATRVHNGHVSMALSCVVDGAGRMPPGGPPGMQKFGDHGGGGGMTVLQQDRLDQLYADLLADIDRCGDAAFWDTRK